MLPCWCLDVSGWRGRRWDYGRINKLGHFQTYNLKIPKLKPYYWSHIISQSMLMSGCFRRLSSKASTSKMRLWVKKQTRLFVTQKYAKIRTKTSHRFANHKYQWICAWMLMSGVRYSGIRVFESIERKRPREFSKRGRR